MCEIHLKVLDVIFGPKHHDFDINTLNVIILQIKI